MCQSGANNWNQWVSYRIGLLWPHVLLTPKPGVEKSPVKLQPKRLEIAEKNGKRACLITHFLTLNLCLEHWTTAQLSPRPQMSERSSSTMWPVIERHDHHCGDDLVFSIHFTKSLQTYQSVPLNNILFLCHALTAWTLLILKEALHFFVSNNEISYTATAETCSAIRKAREWWDSGRRCAGPMF